MPYVSRNKSGKITNVFERPEIGALEQVRFDDPDLLNYIYERDMSSPDTIRDILHDSDQGMVRLIDDLVDLLIAKGVIKFTELPRVAGEKYLQRQAARERLQSEGSLIIAEKDIL